jgi:hypothetical protein
MSDCETCNELGIETKRCKLPNGSYKSICEKCEYDVDNYWDNKFESSRDE